MQGNEPPKQKEKSFSGLPGEPALPPTLLPHGRQEERGSSSSGAALLAQGTGKVGSRFGGSVV